jgi:hypothetical protein
VQCIYSIVSKVSLRKTGVLLNSAGDFGEFSPKKFENGPVGDFQQSEKPAIGGPFCHQRRKFSETRTAWLGWEDSNFCMVESKSATRTYTLKVMGDSFAMRHNRGQATHKTGNFLLRIDWLSCPIGALLWWLGAAKARFRDLPCRVLA